MTKIHKTTITIIILLVTITLLLTLSACFLLPKYNNPQSMEIDGQTYITGFYDNMWPVGIVVGEDEPVAFESKYHKWWKVENAPFEMYCAQNKEALYWNPAIYCKESQFDEVKAYYSDTANYNYFIGEYLKDEQHLMLDKAEEKYAELAIKFIIEIDNAFGVGGHIDQYKDKKLTLITDKFDWDRVTVYRVSKDSFFTTHQVELALYKEKLYIFHSYDAQKELATFYSFDQDISQNMVTLFSKYNII